MIKIQVVTLFDITATGVVGHFKSSKIPYTDLSGQAIVDADSWSRSRNQQRNYETLLQIVSLRTQVFDVTLPELAGGCWQFEFAVEAQGIFGEDNNFSVLTSDSQGVPMLRNNIADIDAVLITSGARQNIWFSVIPINNTLEN